MGAEVSIDFAHTTNGHDAPHIGWRTPGKSNSTGHILLIDVPSGGLADKADKS